MGRNNDRYIVNQSLMGEEGVEYNSLQDAFAAMKDGDMLHVLMANGNRRHMSRDYLHYLDTLVSGSKVPHSSDFLGVATIKIAHAKHHGL